MMISKDYVFSNKNGNLEFVGRFDDLYKNDNDPWGQSGKDKRMGIYYNESRNGIIQILNEKSKHIKSVLEIGCGLGYVVDYISKNTNFDINGADISHTAIKKARSSFPQYKFYEMDIMQQNLKFDKKFDAVILNQLLWYILEDKMGGGGIYMALLNAHSLLCNDSYLIICNAFLTDQRYGKNIINGFGGLFMYINDNMKDKFIIEKALYYKKNNMLYYDGILLLKRI